MSLSTEQKIQNFISDVEEKLNKIADNKCDTYYILLSEFGKHLLIQGNVYYVFKYMIQKNKTTFDHNMSLYYYDNIHNKSPNHHDGHVIALIEDCINKLFDSKKLYPFDKDNIISTSLFEKSTSLCESCREQFTSSTVNKGGCYLTEEEKKKGCLASIKGDICGKPISDLALIDGLTFCDEHWKDVTTMRGKAKEKIKEECYHCDNFRFVKLKGRNYCRTCYYSKNIDESRISLSGRRDSRSKCENCDENVPIYYGFCQYCINVLQLGCETKIPKSSNRCGYPLFEDSFCNRHFVRKEEKK